MRKLLAIGLFLAGVAALAQGVWKDLPPDEAMRRFFDARVVPWNELDERHRTQVIPLMERHGMKCGKRMGALEPGPKMGAGAVETQFRRAYGKPTARKLLGDGRYELRIYPKRWGFFLERTPDKERFQRMIWCELEEGSKLLPRIAPEGADPWSNPYWVLNELPWAKGKVVRADPSTKGVRAMQKVGDLLGRTCEPESVGVFALGSNPPAPAEVLRGLDEIYGLPHRTLLRAIDYKFGVGLSGAAIYETWGFLFTHRLRSTQGRIPVINLILTCRYLPKK